MNAKELLTAIQISGKSVSDNRRDLQTYINIKNKHGNKDTFINYDYLIQELQKTSDRMPTNYQNSHFYNIIVDSFNILDETINNETISYNGKNIEIKPVPMNGTASLKGYNAFIRTDDEPVIVFNDDLLMLTDKLIEIYTKTHWLASNDLLNDKYLDLLTRNFIDVMYCFYFESDAYNAIPLDWCEIENFDDLLSIEKIYENTFEFENLFVNNNYLSFFSQFEESTYLWIAAHEYSHLVLGHLNNDRNLSKGLLNDNIEVEKYSFEWQEEYDADLLGAIITMESKSSFFLSTSIYFAMNCIKLGDLYHSESTSKNHPPISLRIENVFDYFDSNYRYYMGNNKNIDVILNPMVKKYMNFVNNIQSNNLHFSELFEMQRYIYKQYEFE